jgi:hypothetical protein
VSDPADWWRDVAGDAPPRNPLLLVVVGDVPGTVSTLPEDYARSWADLTAQGRTASARVAAHLGVAVHVTGAGGIPPGHDLLLLGDVGRGLTTAAACLAVTHFGAEPQLVTGRGSGVDDLAWMRKVVDVRDRARAAPEDVGAPIRTVAGVLEEAAEQGVPVLLDGVVSIAGAAIAQGTPSMLAPATGDEPAQEVLAGRLDLPTWGMAGLGPGAGLAALQGLALLNLALLASDV